MYCIALLSTVAIVAGIVIPRRYALIVSLSAWLITQIYGFGFLHFPQTLLTYTAGISLGLGAIAATLVAMAIARGRLGLPAITAFVAGFAVYQLITYMGSLWVGGSELYTLPIIAKIFLANAGVFAILLPVASISMHVTRRRESS